MDNVLSVLVQVPEHAGARGGVYLLDQPQHPHVPLLGGERERQAAGGEVEACITTVIISDPAVLLCDCRTPEGRKALRKGRSYAFFPVVSCFV